MTPELPRGKGRPPNYHEGDGGYPNYREGDRRGRDQRGKGTHTNAIRKEGYTEDRVRGGMKRKMIDREEMKIESKTRDSRKEREHERNILRVPQSLFN